MASNTITVNPKKKTGDITILRRNVVQTNVTKGTVLLQNPLPKYGFDLKAKKSSNKTSEKNGEKVETRFETEKQVQKEKSDTENQIGKQIQTRLLQESEDLESKVRSELGEVSGVIKPKEKPVIKVGPITTTFIQVPKSLETVNQNVTNNLTSTGTVCVTDISPVTLSHTSIPPTLTNLNTPPTLPNLTTTNLQPSSQINTAHTDQNMTITTVIHAGEEPANTGFQINSCHTESEADGATSQSNGTRQCESNLQDKVKQLEEEKQLLRNQLDVQLQVNQELKKLLVASVGEDLQHRVERLTRDKALLSMELGDFSKRMVEDYEHLDKISIQADMWRSKYLACRVMSDELASSRAFYAMQFQECQMALQQLLNERHELRINLHEAYRGLQLIQGAFDPLNSQSSLHATSKNILDLSRTNQHLVDTIKYRLLPSHVTSTMSKKIEMDWNDYLTPAEAHARQLMSREMRPEDFRHMAKPLPPGAMSVDRFHPFQNFDNLTFNVCKKCKGDINVV